MKKAIKACLLILLLSCACVCITMSYQFVLGATTLASETFSLMYAYQTAEDWINRVSCAILGGSFCHAKLSDLNDAYDRFLSERSLKDETDYIPIVPPEMRAYGGPIAVPEGALIDWYTVRGETAMGVKGVIAIIAVTPVSGSLPLTGGPISVLFVPAPFVAITKCFDEYSAAIQSGERSDYYAWLITFPAPRVKWEYTPQGAEASLGPNEMVSYLCVVTRAPIEEEIRRMAEDGEVQVYISTHPYAPYIIGLGADLGADIAKAINQESKSQVRNLITEGLQAQFFANIVNLLKGIVNPAYRAHTGQMQIVVTAAGIANVVRFLPTPTPTPTSTPTPTTTATPASPPAVILTPTATPSR